MISNGKKFRFHESEKPSVENHANRIGKYASLQRISSMLRFVLRTHLYVYYMATFYDIVSYYRQMCASRIHIYGTQKKLYRDRIAARTTYAELCVCVCIKEHGALSSWVKIQAFLNLSRTIALYCFN